MEFVCGRRLQLYGLTDQIHDIPDTENSVEEWCLSFVLAGLLKDGSL